MEQYEQARKEFLKELNEAFPKKTPELRLMIKRFEEEETITQADFRHLKEAEGGCGVYGKVNRIIIKYPELKKKLMVVPNNEYVCIGNDN